MRKARYSHHFDTVNMISTPQALFTKHLHTLWEPDPACAREQHFSIGDLMSYDIIIATFACILSPQMSCCVATFA